MKSLSSEWYKVALYVQTVYNIYYQLLSKAVLCTFCKEASYEYPKSPLLMVSLYCAVVIILMGGRPHSIPVMNLSGAI